jgi:hypothetical protein
MTTLIVAAALAAPWSYGGFAGDLEDGRIPSVTIVPRSKRPNSLEGIIDFRANSPAQQSEGRATSPARSSPGIARSASAVPKVATEAATPTLYRLADASGKVWEHTDPAWLRRWVESRNAARMGAGGEVSEAREVQKKRTFMPHSLTPSSGSLTPMFVLPTAPSCSSGRCFRAP